MFRLRPTQHSRLKFRQSGLRVSEEQLQFFGLIMSIPLAGCYNGTDSCRALCFAGMFVFGLPWRCPEAFPRCSMYTTVQISVMRCFFVVQVPFGLATRRGSGGST